MRPLGIRSLVFGVMCLSGLLFGVAQGAPLRFVTYNIAADVNGITQAPPELITVLQGIGSETVNGITRPLDLLALEETTSNAATVAPIVADLNGIYGAGLYAMSPYQATVVNNNPGTGNGPNAIIYNTATLQLIDSVGIVGPSVNGPPRQPVRYQFRPVNAGPRDFYVYVSHAKAGFAASDFVRRDTESQNLRTDAALLPTNSRILYMGDFNTESSTDASYITLTASGPGQGFDPINMPGFWLYGAEFAGILTEEATFLAERLDFQLVTQNVMNDANGLRYISGSYHALGNNGTAGLTGSVIFSTDTGLPFSVLSALTIASDHLPVVADYDVPGHSNGDFDHDGDTDMTDFAHLQICITDLPVSPQCADADMNEDGFVDFNDALLIIKCLAGADRPPGC